MAVGLAVSASTIYESVDVHLSIPLTADEFLYQNQWGEIALLTVGNLSERILMANTTYVSHLIRTNFNRPTSSLDDKKFRTCWWQHDQRDATRLGG